MDLGLMFFGDSSNGEASSHYATILDAARLADDLGYASIWTPERHYHGFGGYFPSPAVLGAALSQVTSRLEIRAGSVVAPLHEAIDIVEQWSVVDNLSGGRAGLALASGWSHMDYWAMPERFDSRHDITAQRIRSVRDLWAGDEQAIVSPTGTRSAIRPFPRPSRSDVPLWLTTGGDHLSFLRAADLGVGVLTALLGQSIDELAVSIAAYRAADTPGRRHVTVMVHTLISEQEDDAWATALPKMREYLRSSMDLELRGTGEDELPAEVRDELIDLKVKEYAERCSLIGSPESVRPMLRELEAIGVDEIACLVDFGPSREQILASLPLMITAAEASHRRSTVP